MNSPLLLKSQPPSSAWRLDAELIFSCLQTIQLLYSTWLNLPLAELPFAFPTPGVSSYSSATFPSILQQVPVGKVSPGLSLAVLTELVRSAVILADLFTTREQFAWLSCCLHT
ncbi:unnamed protein product, partial [Protopolystoma xenopodis]